MAFERKIIEDLKFFLKPGKNFKTYLKQARQKFPANQGRHQEHEKEKILVDLTSDHVGYLLGNLITANYLARQTGLQAEALTEHPFKFKAKRLGTAFGIDNFHSVGRKFLKYSKFPDSKTFHQEELPGSVDDLLNFKMDGILFGDLVYDTCLRNTGQGSLSRVDNALPFLKDALELADFYKSYFTGNDIRYFVTGHIVYSKLGLAARYCLKHGGKVLSRKFASGPFTIRKYDSYEEIFTYEYKFSPEEFESYKKNRHKEALEEAEKFIQKRFKAQANVDDLNVEEAFGKNKKVMDYEELCSLTGLSVDKPLVCIMSHVLPDAPHSNEWMIFRDYYEWLKSVLKIAEEVKEVNWLIKPHPANKHYNKRDEVVDLAQSRYKDSEHIGLAPDNINTASLPGMTKAVVTCNGTAGLEFSALGIPCILGGDSPYSGHGFTVEPKNEQELREVLTSVHELKALSEEKKKEALMYTNLFYNDSRVECAFLPAVPATFWAKIDEEKFWREALSSLEKKMEDDPFYRKFIKQLENDDIHIKNYG